MNCIVRRFDEDCSELNSINATALNLGLPFQVGSVFQLLVPSGNGIPNHGGMFCIDFDGTRIEIQYPYGVEVTLDGPTIQNVGLCYTATVIALECGCKTSN